MCVLVSIVAAQMRKPIAELRVANSVRGDEATPTRVFMFVFRTPGGSLCFIGHSRANGQEFGVVLVRISTPKRIGIISCSPVT